MVLQSLYYRLLQVLVENFMVKNDDQRFAGQNSPDENRLSEIINYIHSNYQRKISLSELSGALYLSVPYLSKYIKRQMGMNFIDYVNNIRLFHAVDDLLYTNNSITMIALENGFANAASFTKRLKDTYGLTPSEYRQKMKVHPEKEGKKQKSNRSVLEKKISDYLDNQVVQEPLDVNSHDSYIILDARNKEEYDPYWKRMLNIGRLEDLLRSDMREQVLRLAFDGRSIPVECEKGVVKQDRVWWVQCEGINGYVSGYLKDKTRTDYLAAAEKLWDFTKTYVVDSRPGSEWFWYTDASGVPAHDPIVEPWKCPYHNGRMCLLVLNNL